MKVSELRVKSVSVASAIAVALGKEGLAPYFPHPSLGPSVENGLPDTDNADEFRDEYFRRELLRKSACFDIPGVDRERAAFDAFVEAESDCKKSNRRFSAWQISHELDQRVLYRAKRLISGVLGPFSWDRVLADCNFGPGASTSLNRHVSFPQNKWNPKRVSHCTAFVLPLYETFRKWASTRFNHKIEVVAGNRVTTVRKDALKDRTIAIEPDWNMFFQKGLGGVIRRCLQRKCGLLHPSAQYEHQALAAIASKHGTLATLDLSMASDTVSLELCRALLPQDWFSGIFRLRSPVGTISFGGVDETVEYEKISSMGNGYTFELETLIFWALARAVCGNDSTVSVYGDDIIVPTAFAPRVMEVLRSCGFTPNARKSHWTGPFRESCGGHYFRGVDVTPVYFKPEDEVVDMCDLIDLGNRLNLWATPDGWLDSRLYGVLEGMRRWVPKFLWGPYGVAGTLWTAGYDIRQSGKYHHDFQAWRQKYLVKSQKRYKIHDTLGAGALLNNLWARDPDTDTRMRYLPGVDDLVMSSVSKGMGHKVQVKTRILDGWDDAKPDLTDLVERH